MNMRITIITISTTIIPSIISTFIIISSSSYVYVCIWILNPVDPQSEWIGDN